MATIATNEMKWLAAEWKKLFPSAVFSGIVGDRAHARRGGYHISREDQGSGNYSVTRPGDRKGPGNAAAAIDMTMSREDMIKCTTRLRVAFADKSDPRRRFVNGFNGHDGSKQARRYDFVGGRVGSATNDHLSHIHLEIIREWVASMIAMRAILSLLRGDSKEGYARSIGVATGPKVAAMTAPAYPGRILRRNDKQAGPDAAVAAWQRRLQQRGWAGIADDGLFGPKLEGAVKALQKQAGLATDGVIGPKTWPIAWSLKVK